MKSVLARYKTLQRAALSHRHGVRLFSSNNPQQGESGEKGQPAVAKEYKVDEKEIFSEEKMAEARESIKEKLRKIAEQQERQEGEAKHNPGDFAFTKYHRMDTKPQQQVYYYSKTLKFPPEKDGLAIFQMNTDIYRTGNAVDAIVGATLFYSSYKVGSQFYILALGAGWASFSVTSTLFWSVMIAGQLNYLTQTYLRQVFLVSEIELLKNCEEIRIRTVLNDRVPTVFNLFGKKSADTTGDVIVKISDVRFSEKDQPNSAIMRIIAGDKRYYIHKNMSKVQDFELLKAVMNENIKKIECFK